MTAIGKWMRNLTYFLVLVEIDQGEPKRSIVKKIVRIEEFQNCKDRPNTEQYFKNHNHLANVKIQRIKMDQYMSGDYVVTHPMKTIQGNIQILKCESKDPSTCEFLMTMKTPNICDRLIEKGTFWTPLMESVQPRVKCPLVKQVYRFNNGTFSTIASTPFVTGIPGGTNFFWAIKFAYAEGDDDETGCMYIMFKVYNVKVKQ